MVGFYFLHTKHRWLLSIVSLLLSGRIGLFFETHEIGGPILFSSAIFCLPMAYSFTYSLFNIVDYFLSHNPSKKQDGFAKTKIGIVGVWIFIVIMTLIIWFFVYSLLIVPGADMAALRR